MLFNLLAARRFMFPSKVLAGSRTARVKKQSSTDVIGAKTASPSLPGLEPVLKFRLNYVSRCTI